MTLRDLERFTTEVNPCFENREEEQRCAKVG